MLKKVFGFAFLTFIAFALLAQEEIDSTAWYTFDEQALDQNTADKKGNTGLPMLRTMSLSTASNVSQASNVTIPSEAANWVFGSYLGMTFNAGNSQSFFSSSMKAGEGCASISDAEGNLLLYTNGIHVYNAQGHKLNNKDNLPGSSAATQSGIIVPYPGNASRYFIFTVPDTKDGAKGFCYAVADLSLTNAHGSKGALLAIDGAKNYVRVLAGCVERVAAVAHKNGVDYWVVVDKKGTDEYYVYKVTEAGIDTANPVINAIGTKHLGDNTFGGIKFSPDGSKLASARGMIDVIHSSIEVFDFDNETGKLSGRHDLTPTVGDKEYYGVEFSPDGNYLYVASLNRDIFQSDLRTHVTKHIHAGEEETTRNGGMLQLGIDGNIYFSHRKNGLFKITNPNEKKSLESFALLPTNSGTGTGLGLPNFISNYSDPYADCLDLDFSYGYYPDICGTKFIPLFENENDCKIISYLWDFGDGSTSAKAEPFHVFTTPAVFQVTLELTYRCSGCRRRTERVAVQVDVTEDPFSETESISVTTQLTENVLSASAATFADSWRIPYDNAQLADNHPYLNGMKGVWRNAGSHVYRQERQSAESPDIRRDGTFQLETFNWAYADYGAIPGWLQPNAVTQYSPYSYELENQDILGNSSAAIYGFGGQLPVAVGQDMTHQEMAYASFEDMVNSGLGSADDASQKGHGNWTITTGGVAGQSLRFEVKSGKGNLALVKAPLSELEGVDTVSVVWIRPVISLFGISIPIFGMVQDVAIRCKEPYGEYAEYTRVVLDEVIRSRWVGLLHYEKPYKQGSTVSISETVAHTGTKSLQITEPKTTKQHYLKLTPGKIYHLAAWVSINDPYLYTPVLGQNLGIRLQFYNHDDVQIGTTFAQPNGPLIEGWQQLETQFTCPEGTATFSITFEPGTATTVYFDDMRLFPDQGNMQSYVYDPQTFRLKAVLDQNNYASRYYYDAEGNLHVVKKETERGIRTIQESINYQQTTR